MANPIQYLAPIQLPPINSRQFSVNPTPGLGVVRDVSAYASDLVRWESSHKHKFLFITEIVLNDKYKNIADVTRFALLTQTATRPKLKFEHVEYNEYGIRKGVLTKTIFEPVTVSCIDDNDNSAMQLFTNVTRLMSPITNIENSSLTDYSQYDFRTAAGTISAINTTTTGISVQEQSTGQHKPNVYAQSSGYPGEDHASSTSGSPTSIFKSIKIHHVHMFGEGVNTFTFHNPRLLTMDFDDLDMSASSDISTLKLSFGYDYLTSFTGTMTADISKLVGSPNYYLRRDLP